MISLGIKAMDIYVCFKPNLQIVHNALCMPSGVMKDDQKNFHVIMCSVRVEIFFMIHYIKITVG